MTSSSHTKCRVRTLSLLAAPFLPALFSSQAIAQQAQLLPQDHTNTFEARVSAVHSDNVVRDAAANVQGTLYSAGFGVDYNRDGRKLDVLARGDLDWIHFPHNTFDDELQGFFDGFAKYDLVSDFLEWDLRDTYGQQLADPLAAATPSNLRGVNYLATGPRATWRVGDSTELALIGVYAKTTYENQNIDNNRVGGGVSLTRQLSSRGLLSLNASTEHVTFDDSSLGADYDLYHYFAAYDIRTSRTGLRAEVGFSQIDLDNQKSSGLLARLQAERRISGSSRVRVFASRQFTDGRDVLGTGLDQGSGTTAPLAISTADPFIQRVIGAGYQFERSRTILTLNLTRLKESYETNIVNDRKVDRFDFDFSRRVGPQSTLRLEGYYQREDYLNFDFQSREKRLAAIYEWLFGRDFGASAQYNWTKRTAALTTSEFTERRIGITLFYRPGRQGRL